MQPYLDVVEPSVPLGTVTSPGRKPLEEREADWAFRITQTVARQVARYRSQMTPKMSAQRLAERCSELGLPMTRNTVAALESGRKDRVSVPELLVLARALDVPPVALLLPLSESAEVEILPGTDLPTDQAEAWLAGTARQYTELGPLSLPPQWLGDNGRLQRLRNHRKWVDEAEGLAADLEYEESKADPDQDRIKELRLRWSQTWIPLKLSRDSFREYGQVPPQLPASLEVIEQRERAAQGQVD